MTYNKSLLFVLATWILLSETKNIAKIVSFFFFLTDESFIWTRQKYLHIVSFYTES